MRKALKSIVVGYKPFLRFNRVKACKSHELDRAVTSDECLKIILDYYENTNSEKDSEPNEQIIRDSQGREACTTESGPGPIGNGIQ